MINDYIWVINDDLDDNADNNTIKEKESIVDSERIKEKC